MFSSARWRLTLWFGGAVAIIIVLLGFVVYLVAQRLLMDGVEDDLRARAERETRPLVARIQESQSAQADGQPMRDLKLGPAFTAGGYFYALAGGGGQVIASTANADPKGLAPVGEVAEALEDGARFVDGESSDGQELRLYLVPLRGPQVSQFVLEVGRSIEPELDALRRLLFVLAAGGGVAVLLAGTAGYFLAGRALAPISRAVDRQQAFVADASHELRTPLSLIRANAELLKRSFREGRRGSGRNIDSVDDIIRDTDHLSAIVGQMLTLAMADAGATPFQLTPLDLRSLVTEAGRQVAPLAAEKGITLAVSADGTVGVSGDPVRLRELLLILLDNALKFSPQGGKIDLALRVAGGRAKLTVADNGPGIPPEALPHVFERFYRADKARSREEGGAGLGLAIAKWIAEGHNGSIRVESRPGAGATFEVDLPASPEPA